MKQNKKQLLMAVILPPLPWMMIVFYGLQFKYQKALAGHVNAKTPLIFYTPCLVAALATYFIFRKYWGLNLCVIHIYIFLNILWFFPMLIFSIVLLLPGPLD
jgi:hypothetical protein